VVGPGAATIPSAAVLFACLPGRCAGRRGPLRPALPRSLPSPVVAQALPPGRCSAWLVALTGLALALSLWLDPAC